MLLANLLRPTAVYWPPETSVQYDAFGQPLRGAGREITCRWEDTAEEFIGPDGEKRVSKSKVFTDSDLEVGGLLYLGSLEDTEDSGFPTDPREAGAVEVKSFSRTPTINNAQTIKQAYL